MLASTIGLRANAMATAVPRRRSVVVAQAAARGRNGSWRDSKLNAPSYPAASTAENSSPASRGSSTGSVIEMRIG